MTEEEFNLSEKIIINILQPDRFIEIKDVKEFIRRLKEEIEMDSDWFDDEVKEFSECKGKEMFKKTILKEIDKLAGEKLR